MKQIIQTKIISVVDEDLVISSATELGRIHGRDNDWAPDTLNAAIDELEMLGECSPQSNGYEVKSTQFNESSDEMMLVKQQDVLDFFSAATTPSHQSGDEEIHTYINFFQTYNLEHFLPLSVVKRFYPSTTRTK